MWDETRYVSGYPGESVVLARRSGNTWYVAGINGKDEVQTLTTDLSFISKAKALLFADDASGEWLISTIDKLPSQVTCQPRGGFLCYVLSMPSTSGVVHLDALDGFEEVV